MWEEKIKACRRVGEAQEKPESGFDGKWKEKQGKGGIFIWLYVGKEKWWLWTGEKHRKVRERERENGRGNQRLV